MDKYSWMNDYKFIYVHIKELICNVSSLNISIDNSTTETFFEKLTNISKNHSFMKEINSYERKTIDHINEKCDFSDVVYKKPIDKQYPSNNMNKKLVDKQYPSNNINKKLVDKQYLSNGDLSHLNLIPKNTEYNINIFVKKKKTIKKNKREGWIKDKSKGWIKDKNKSKNKSKNKNKNKNKRCNSRRKSRRKNR
jgi:hypothetical protein